MIPPFFRQLKYHQTPKNQLLFSVALMYFFWCIFDGIISFVTPVLITEKGFSNTLMGLIIASSSVAGAFFDFVLSKVLKNTNYIRFFFLLLAISFAYPLILGASNTIFLFVISMAIWGLYYDISNFGIFDFVSRNSEDDEHCHHSGVISVFKSLGYLLAPIIAGFVLVDGFAGQSLSYSYVFLIIAALFFVLVFLLSHDHFGIHQQGVHKRTIGLVHELKLWYRVGHILFPVLIFTMLLDIIDASIWTIGPVFSESFPHLDNFAGLFMGASTLPMLITGWFVEPITARFGKKKTAYISVLISSIFLVFIPFIHNPYLIVLNMFASSFFSSFAWPSIKGAFVDYIDESRAYEKEIAGLNDFFTNLGYVIGPIFIGISSDLIGITKSFSVLGIISIFTVVFLFLVTPRKIRVVLSRNKK